MAEEVKTVAVVGAGTMGSGIATVVVRGGHRTILFDIDEEGVQRGLDFVRGFLAKSVAKGKLDQAEADAALARLSGTSDLSELSGVDVVIEAVFEDLQVKQDLLGRLDDVIAPTALIHTNTSTLSVTAIAAGSRHPERVVGTHYCNPAPLMRLVELVDGLHTASWAHDATAEFLVSVDKTACVVKDRPGFILNRFLIPWENSCINALENGLGTRDEIDAAVTGALGHPMGPFRLLDIVGLDVHKQVATRLYEQLKEPRFAPPPLVDRMIAAGDLGRKTGRGFYTYEDTALFGA